MDIIFIRNLGRQQQEDQILKAGAMLKQLGFEPTLVLHSGEDRNIRTAQAIVGERRVQLEEVPELNRFLPDRDTYYRVVDPLVKELGVDAPISAYLEKDHEGVLLASANRVVQKMRAIIENSGADKVLIVGHHISQNLFGIALTDQMNPLFLGPHFPPLTGFRIHEDGSITEVKLVE